MSHGDSVEKHGTEMEDILIMHLIAKTHTNGGRLFTGVVTTTGDRTAFHRTVFHFVRPHIVYKGYVPYRKRQSVVAR